MKSKQKDGMISPLERGWTVPWAKEHGGLLRWEEWAWDDFGIVYVGLLFTWDLW